MSNKCCRAGEQESWESWNLCNVCDVWSIWRPNPQFADAESKEHDSGLEQSHGSDEGSFPLVLFLDANVVVSLANVKLGEQGGFLHIINEFRDKGEWIGILDGVGVQVAVILTWT